MDITTALARVVDHIDLSTEEMQDVMRQIMTGQCTDAQIGGFLVALRMKSESLDEITGAALAMRELASEVSIQGEHLVDTCGTGGDGSNIFNVSSAAAFVVAAAGGQVAKHGNRAVSGKSGSADLLEAAGINLNLTPEQVARCVEHVGVGFMFAPAHHGAMKYAVGPRRELGLRTHRHHWGRLSGRCRCRRCCAAWQGCSPVHRVRWPTASAQAVARCRDGRGRDGRGHCRPRSRRSGHRWSGRRGRDGGGCWLRHGRMPCRFPRR